jgi:hypothetical protein
MSIQQRDKLSFWRGNLKNRQEQVNVENGFISIQFHLIGQRGVAGAAEPDIN